MSEQFLSIQEHNEFVKRMDDENNRQNHRLDTVERAIGQLNELVSSVKVLAVNVESIAKEINEQSVRLKEIEGKPAKRWETIVGCVITGIVGAAISYFITH